jgi:hypothetical protein
MKTKILRCQIRLGGIDTTVRSARGVFAEFAPTWDMVMGHKGGTVSDSEYTADYLLILHHAFAGWKALRTDNTVTISCYCTDGKFCHTLLIGLYASLRWPPIFEDHTRSKEVLSPETVKQVEDYVNATYL